MKAKIIFLVLTGLAVFAGSLFAGPTFINPISAGGIEREILINIRLPRVLVAALIGTALGASGAVLQGILKNPLADPYILGISSGAALAAAGGLIFGAGAFGISVLAFAGALATGGIVGLLGSRGGWAEGGIRPERLLLAGIGLGFLFSAALMLMMSVSSDEGLRRAVLWMFGDLSMAEWSLIPYGFLSIGLGLFISIYRAEALNSLMLGDDLAHSLGFSAGKERLVLFASVCLMTAASVSLGGIIGFIGLLMPHIMRFFVGSNNILLIPASAFGGAVLLVLSDFLGRTLIRPAELPSGIITALIGAPYFLYLLRRRGVLGE